MIPEDLAPRSIWLDLGRTTLEIGAGMGPVAAFLLTANGLGDMFGVNVAWLKQLGWPGITMMILAGAVAGLVLNAIRAFGRERKARALLAQLESAGAGSSKLSSELVKLVERGYQAHNWMEVVRFGSPLSRAMLLSGMYADRAHIGERVSDAAAKLKMNEEQAAALIDDVGWSNVLIGNLSRAERAISRGINIALNAHLHYLAAKGERHLAGICQWYAGTLDKAEEHYTKVMQHAEHISDANSKLEMKAGTLFGMADLRRLQGNLPEALRLAEESKSIYSQLPDQGERLIKAYSQLGMIHLRIGNLDEAEDLFHLGHSEATRYGRKDELAKSVFGLGQVFLASKDFANAHEQFREAAERFRDLGMSREAAQAEEQRIHAEVGMKLSSKQSDSKGG